MWWIGIFTIKINKLTGGKMKMIIIILTIILAGVFFFGYFYSEGTRCTIVEYQKDDRIIAIVPNLHMGSKKWEKELYKYIYNYNDKGNKNFDLIIHENTFSNGDLWTDIMKPYRNIAKYINYNYFMHKDIFFNQYNDTIIVDHTLEQIHKYHPPEKIEAFKKDVDFLLQFPPWIVKSIFGFRAGWAYYFEQNDPLVKLRNPLPLMRAICKYSKVKKIAIVYGKAHQPGMERILVDFNWVKIREIKTFPFMR